MKYAVGDYVTRPDWVLLGVETAIDGEVPLYGLYNPRTNNIDWHTEYELDDKEVVKASPPNFDLWASIEVGEMVRTGNDQSGYAKVIARTGDLVMISITPLTKTEKDRFESLASQLEDLTDGTISKDEVKKKLDLPKSTSAAYKTPSKWRTVRQLALMNWELIRE